MRGESNGGSLRLSDTEGDRVWANNQDIDVMLAMTRKNFAVDRRLFRPTVRLIRSLEFLDEQ